MSVFISEHTRVYHRKNVQKYKLLLRCNCGARESDRAASKYIVIEVKVAKAGCTWKFGFCQDMSVALGVQS
jgi:hypothetical protein